jgi:hypothetical protein
VVGGYGWAHHAAWYRSSAEFPCSVKPYLEWDIPRRRGWPRSVRDSRLIALFRTQSYRTPFHTITFILPPTTSPLLGPCPLPWKLLKSVGALKTALHRLACLSSEPFQPSSNKLKVFFLKHHFNNSLIHAEVLVFTVNQR